MIYTVDDDETVLHVFDLARLATAESYHIAIITVLECPNSSYNDDTDLSFV